MTQIRNKVVKVHTKFAKQSSYSWLNRQLNDPYVIRAKHDGYKSRAAYKLIEINDKFHLFNKAMSVIDLGAAPGGWSQVAAHLIGANGTVVAIDLLSMDPIPGVITIELDFYEPTAHQEIISLLKNQKADVVMSDMAANTTGHPKTDHLRIMDLCERSFAFAMKVLNPGGHFIAKILRGGTEHELLKQIKLHFEEVKHFKPKSSRAESREIYLVAKNFKKRDGDKA